eukprot:9634970-Prorocentrum_lima.AAC.1
MTSSLVGSEMCIRDRRGCVEQNGKRVEDILSHTEAMRVLTSRADCRQPVSYTHLTLPTICSV